MDKSSLGKLSYIKGHAAEDQVAIAYERNGFEIVERRWKTKVGEMLNHMWDSKLQTLGPSHLPI